MNFVNQINLDIENANRYSRHEDDYNKSGCYIDIEDFHQSFLNSFYSAHSLPALHYWGDGFCQGDASAEEMNELAARGLVVLDEDEEINPDFSALDKLFIYPYRDAVMQAIEEAKANETAWI